MGLPYGGAALVQSLKGVGYESASFRYGYFPDFYGGDVLMRKLLLFLLMLAPGISAAAVVVKPQIAGYAVGSYRAAAGSFAMTAANDGYIAQAVANVGGRAVTMPATLRMAANAGRIALEGARLSPLLLAGSLILPWLIDHAMNYDQNTGQWMVTQPSSGYTLCETSSGGNFTGDEASVYAHLMGVMSSLYGPGYITKYPVGDPGNWCASNGCTEAAKWFTNAGGWYGSYLCNGPLAQASTAPATDNDWNNLPDPLPAIAPELPSAPYLPGGVPVLDPEYQPQDVPIGDPYKMPDGSTVQDHAQITPSAGGQVTVVTYTQTIIDATGNPVSDAPKNVTPDQPDLCQLHPDSVACMSAGGPPTFTPPTDGGAPADPSIVAAGGAIDWHQHFLDESSVCGLADVSYSVMNQQFTIPLSSLCQYLPILKAVVIFLASIVSIRMFALAPW